MKPLPFLRGFREAIESGRKTCTARTTKYGEPGELLSTPFGNVRLTAVEKVPLCLVRDSYWQQEGVDSPEAFEDVWRKLHPRVGFDPEREVWLHSFVFVGAECRRATSREGRPRLVFHIALTGDVDEHGRLTTRCFRQRPERYVFDLPVDGQPMCDVCVRKWAEATGAEAPS